jgi:ABC-type spermidine/putrescine transport system permease subunit II
VTPEIVTGVAALLFFHGLGMKLSLVTVTLAEITFSIAYVTVIVRGRLASMSPEVEEAARDLGCTPFQALRLVTLPSLVPALLGASLLVFALVFDDFVLAFFTTGVDPQPLPVRIYSSIRFGVSPAINAVGTCVLLFSALLIILALVVPRLFHSKTSSLDMLTGGESR